MDDLIAFINARLDEDEATAKAADPGPWEVGPKLGAHDNMVYVREKDSPGIDTVGLTYRDPVFVSQVPNKTRPRENAAHIARHDPARALREVAALRAILAGYADEAGARYPDFDGGYAEGTYAALKHLAAIWSDHPDYRAEWRP